MDRKHLEELCIAQLGGGPWLLSEFLPVEPKPTDRYTVQARPGFFQVQRMVGPGGGPLFVKGESWKDCAQQLGIIETSVETGELFEEAHESDV